MKVTYYSPNKDGGNCIANFGVLIPEWRMIINNLKILKGRTSGWFIALPSHKNKELDRWQPTVEFDKDTQSKFLTSARKAIEEFSQKTGVIVG